MAYSIGHWFVAPEQFEELRATLIDPENFPDTHAALVDRAEAFFAEVREQGVEPVKVYITPQCFLAWCQYRKCEPSVAALGEYTPGLMAGLWSEQVE